MVLLLAVAAHPALAQCSASGALVPNSTVVCNGAQTTRVGQGPGADGVTLTANDASSIAVTNANAISLGNNVTITLGSSGPVAGGSAANVPVLVQTTTDAGHTGGQYGDGNNTIDLGSNSTILINRNASVIARGTDNSAEAINPFGPGNRIVNYGLIQGGPSSALYFQNVGTNAASPRNVVDNYGTIQLIPIGSVNPVTGGQALGANGNVGIDFTNETGARVLGNLDFGGGNDRVTLNPGSTVSGNFNGGGGSNTLTLNATAGSSDTLTGAVNNFEVLNKTGAGLWTLAGSVGANGAGGSIPLAVNVIGGTLSMTGNNASFNGSIVVNPGVNLATPGPDPTATLQARAQSLPPLITDHGVVLINQVSPDGIQPNDGTYAGMINGTGVVSKIGVGTLALTGANTYSGGTNLNVGAILVGADNALGAAAGPLTFNGGTLRLNRSFDLSAARPVTLNAPNSGFAGSGTIDTNGQVMTIGQGITGAGGLTVTDSTAAPGTLILTGANTYAGGTTILAGTLQLGNGGTSGSILGNVADNGTLAFRRSDVVGFPGVISGTGALLQIGAGTTILTAANTYGGGTTISGGTLQLGNGGTSGGIVGNVLDNGVLAFNRSDTVIVPGTITGTGALTQIGTGRTILTANNDYTGGTTISAGTLQLGNGGGTVGRVIGPILDNGALVFDRADIASNPGPISGTGSVAQIGTGTEILSAANTYTGGTTVSAGTLQIGDGNVSGSIVGNVVTNATLAFNRVDVVTFPGLISGTGGIAQYGAGTTILTGADTYTGGTRIAAGTVQLGDGGTSGSIVGDVSATSGTLAFDRSDVVTFPGTISGVGGSVAQIGSGTTILTAANRYTNGTSIGAGTLQLGNGGTVGSIIGDVADNGTLAFNRSDVVTFPGLITGTGGVTQIGSGTTILTANEGYTGITTISTGILQIGNGGTSGRIVGPILDNALLVFNRSDVTSVPGAISGTGAVTQLGTGTTILTGDSTYSGGTTISAGTLQLGNGGTSGSIVGNVADNGTLAFNRADVVTFPGIVSGSGGLIQAGAGTTILPAVNSYAGATVVSAGTLAIGDAAHPGAALAGGGPTTVSPGGVLAGYGSVTGTVNNQGTLAVANALPLFAGGGAGTFTINAGLQNGGLLALSAPVGTGNVLAVAGSYAGSGGSALAINTVLNAGGRLSNQFTDRLLIGGNATGGTAVRVTATGGGAFTSTGVPNPADGISIIQVAGASSPGSFALPNGYITGGTPYQYQLYAYGPGSPNGAASAAQSLVGNPAGHWDYRLQNAYVSPEGPVQPQPEPPVGPDGNIPDGGPVAPPTDVRLEVAPQVPAYLSAATALFNAGFQDIDALHRRLGEIRDDQTRGLNHQGEVFVRAYGSTTNYASSRSFTDLGFGFSEAYSAVQFGGSTIPVDDANGTLRLGVAGALGRLWMTPSAVDGRSKALFNSQKLSGIATYQAHAGWYVDAIVTGGLIDGRVTTQQRGQVTGLNASSISASVEAGYPVPLPWQRLELEPQAQLVFQHLNFNQRTDTDGLNVSLGSPNQGIARIGGRLKRPFGTDDGMLITPYLKFNVLQGFADGSNVEIANSQFGTGTYGTALQVGGGATGSLTRSLSIFGDVAWQQNVSTGGFRGWVFNAGLRYAFGATAAAIAVAAPQPAAPRSYLVFFDWDRAELTDRARQIIATAASQATGAQPARIEVQGHADRTGAASYNQALSLRRAEAVAAELVRHGIARAAITVEGFGDRQPLVQTGPGVRESQNRRVEIVFR